MGAWRKEVKLDEDFKPIQQEWVDSVAVLVGQGKPVSIVDAGSGNGKKIIPYVALLARRGHAITAHLLDISPEAIRRVQEETLIQAQLSRSVTVDAQIGDVVAMPYESASQHGLFSESVLPWLGSEEKVREALAEFQRVLMKGGYAYIEVMSPFNNTSLNGIPGKIREQRVQEVEVALSMNPQKPYVFRHPVFRDELGNPRIIAYLGLPALDTMITSAGLRVLKADPYKNEAFPNGLGTNYPENIRVLAQKP